MRGVYLEFDNIWLDLSHTLRSLENTFRVCTNVRKHWQPREQEEACGFQGPVAEGQGHVRVPHVQNEGCMDFVFVSRWSCFWPPGLSWRPLVATVCFLMVVRVFGAEHELCACPFRPLAGCFGNLSKIGWI